MVSGVDKGRASMLLKAAHRAPTLAVTALATAIALAAGAPWLWTLLAVLSGQLSVGWTNDLIDRHRDAELGRREKPLVSGALTARVLARAIAVASVLAIPLSFLAFGLLGGVLHLIAIASAQTYNLRLKSTVLSLLPYALSFALLPTAILMGAGAARPWQLALEGGVLGVSAHLINVVRDIEGDRTQDIWGFPQRIGPVMSTRLAVLLLMAVALLLFEEWSLRVLTIAAATALLFLPIRLRFAGLIALVVLDVALLLDSLTT